LADQKANGTMILKQLVPAGICVCAVIGLQLLFSATGTAFYLTQLTMAAYYTVVAIGLCLLMGYAGQISLGHAAFFAIGGYSAAVANITNLAPYQQTMPVSWLTTVGLAVTAKDLYGATVIHLHPWIGLLAGVFLAVGAALLIGIPALRLKGHYLAMATLGFGTIVYRIVLATRLFGEADGLSDVGGFTILPGLRICGDRAFRVQNYYAAWVCVLVASILVSNLVRSRPGRALRAIHGNEEAASAMGVNVARYKLYLFILSAAFAAVAGALLAHFNGGIGPSESGVMKSIRYVAMVAVGGMANLWGTIIASTILNFLSLRGYFGSYDDAVFGAILVIFMMVSNWSTIAGLPAKFLSKQQRPGT
jgi:branched-chain amino acid transport system permease protein